MRIEDGAMSDLSEFLLARIAEDEARAQAATAGRWQWADDPEDGLDAGDESVIGASGMHTEGYVYVKPEDADHIAHWDPARVLAECDAKRRIVELHKSWPVLVEQQPKFAAPAAGLNDMTFRMTQQIAWVTQEEYRKRFGEEPPTTPMLRALALPYADHPDYDPAWQL